MLNVVATLQQRCGNVLITSESEVVTTLETDVRTTLIFDRATTLWQRQQRLVTTLSQRRCASWVVLYASKVILLRNHSLTQIFFVFFS